MNCCNSHDHVPDSERQQNTADPKPQKFSATNWVITFLIAVALIYLLVKVF